MCWINIGKEHTKSPKLPKVSNGSPVNRVKTNEVVATDSSLHSRPQSASNKRENDDAGKLEGKSGRLEHVNCKNNFVKPMYLVLESRKKIKITIKGVSYRFEDKS